MDYFHRRNRPPPEYSGFEDASPSLRRRLALIHDEYLTEATVTGYSMPRRKFDLHFQQQFPGAELAELLAGGDYDRVFTVAELLHALVGDLYENRRTACRQQLREAFRLSGSVYALRPAGSVELIPTEMTAKNLATVSKILSPYDVAHSTFFTAAGDLMGRRRKPDDIVKDLFVGTESYLKQTTNENDYGSAIKTLSKVGAINAMQKLVLDKLHGFRSDAHGAGHAGNSPAPSEAEAMWFLNTMLAQLMFIDSQLKKATGNKSR